MAAPVLISRAGLIVVIARKSTEPSGRARSWPVLDALARWGGRTARQGRPDQVAIRREPAPPALRPQLVDQPDRQGRIGEDRRPDLDRDCADREEVEDIG